MELNIDGDKIDECIDTITFAIKRKTEKANAKGVVVSLSGGIDSSLVLHIANEVADVVALMLPESDADKKDLQDSIELAKKYGVDYEVIRLDDVLKSLDKSFAWEKFPSDRTIPWGNVKARARMIYAYLIANLDNRIVLGASNKTELLLGYFTKYGDGGADMLPIGDLYKAHVWAMARHVGLPENIIGKTPSAGLWPGQTDEDELGLSYESIDRVLYCLTEKRLPVEKTAQEVSAPLDKVKELQERMLKNGHKIRVPEIVRLS